MVRAFAFRFRGFQVFRVGCLGFRVRGSGFSRFRTFDFGVSRSGFRIWGFQGFTVRC